MRTSTLWLVVAVISLVVNVGGLVYAAVMGELSHAGLHLALLFPTAILLRRFAPERFALGGSGQPLGAGPSHELTDRLTYLEASLDAAAINIERIGEGQRFMTRVFAENGTPGSASDAPDPANGEPPRPPPPVRGY